MSSILRRLDDALATPVDDLSLNDVRVQMHMVRSAQAVAAARLVELNRRLNDLAASRELPIGVDPVRELRTHGGLRSRDVRSVEYQAAAVDASADLGRMWSAGVTSTAHVETLGRALDTVGEGRERMLERVGEITDKAAVMRIDDFDRYVKRVVRESQPDEGVEQFERQRRLTQMRMWNAADGMLHLSGCFDPERGAALANLVDRRVESMFHGGDREVSIDVAPGVEPNDHRRALALFALCTGAVTDGDGAVDARPTRAEVIVHVDLATLQNGLHERSVCRTDHGADLPPATARRLACDAEIIPLVLDRHSVPLDVGRSRRLATVHQRRALEGVHLTCAMPECTVGFGHCTIHHITPWERGGPTDLGNLVPLCSRHHHAVHEGGWTIRLDPVTRRVEVAPPGARLADAPAGPGATSVAVESPHAAVRVGVVPGHAARPTADRAGGRTSAAAGHAAGAVRAVRSAAGHASGAARSAAGHAGSEARSAAGHAGSTARSAAGRAGGASGAAVTAAGRAGATVRSAAGRSGGTARLAAGHAGSTARSAVTAAGPP